MFPKRLMSTLACLLVAFAGSARAEYPDPHYDVLTVGETPDVSTRDGVRFTHPQAGVMSMLFQFEHMHLDAQPGEASARAAASTPGGWVT